MDVERISPKDWPLLLGEIYDHDATYRDKKFGVDLPPFHICPVTGSTCTRTLGVASAAHYVAALVECDVEGKKSYHLHMWDGVIDQEKDEGMRISLSDVFGEHISGEDSVEANPTLFPVASSHLAIATATTVAIFNPMSRSVVITCHLGDLERDSSGLSPVISSIASAGGLIVAATTSSHIVIWKVTGFLADTPSSPRRAYGQDPSLVIPNMKPLVTELMIDAGDELIAFDGEHEFSVFCLHMGTSLVTRLSLKGSMSGMGSLRLDGEFGTLLDIREAENSRTKSESDRAVSALLSQMDGENSNSAGGTSASSSREQSRILEPIPEGICAKSAHLARHSDSLFVGFHGKVYELSARTLCIRSSMLVSESGTTRPMVRSQSKYLFVASGEKVTCFLPDDDRVIGPDSVWGALDVCTKDTFISSLSLPFALLPYNGKLNGKPLPSSLIKDMFDVGPPSGWRGPRIATLDVNGLVRVWDPRTCTIQDSFSVNGVEEGVNAVACEGVVYLFRPLHKLEEGETILINRHRCSTTIASSDDRLNLMGYPIAMSSRVAEAQDSDGVLDSDLHLQNLNDRRAIMRIMMHFHHQDENVQFSKFPIHPTSSSNDPQQLPSSMAIQEKSNVDSVALFKDWKLLNTIQKFHFRPPRKGYLSLRSGRGWEVCYFSLLGGFLLVAIDKYELPEYYVPLDKHSKCGLRRSRSHSLDWDAPDLATSPRSRDSAASSSFSSSDTVQSTSSMPNLPVPPKAGTARVPPGPLEIHIEGEGTTYILRGCDDADSRSWAQAIGAVCTLYGGSYETDNEKIEKSVDKERDVLDRDATHRGVRSLTKGINKRKIIQGSRSVKGIIEKKAKANIRKGSSAMIGRAERSIDKMRSSPVIDDGRSNRRNPSPVPTSTQPSMSMDEVEDASNSITEWMQAADKGSAQSLIPFEELHIFGLTKRMALTGLQVMLDDLICSLRASTRRTWLRCLEIDSAMQKTVQESDAKLFTSFDALHDENALQLDSEQKNQLSSLHECLEIIAASELQDADTEEYIDDGDLRASLHTIAKHLLLCSELRRRYCIISRASGLVITPETRITSPREQSPTSPALLTRDSRESALDEKDLSGRSPSLSPSPSSPGTNSLLSDPSLSPRSIEFVEGNRTDVSSEESLQAESRKSDNSDDDSGSFVVSPRGTRRNASRRHSMGIVTAVEKQESGEVVSRELSGPLSWTKPEFAQLKQSSAERWDGLRRSNTNMMGHRRSPVPSLSRERDSSSSPRSGSESPSSGSTLWSSGGVRGQSRSQSQSQIGGAGLKGTRDGRAKSTNESCPIEKR